MSKTLDECSDQELINELARRNAGPRCKCSRWRTYYGAWDRDGLTWRCHGCLKSITKCTCR